MLWATMMPSQGSKYKRNRTLGAVAHGNTFCGIAPPFFGVQKVALLHTPLSVKDLHENPRKIGNCTLPPKAAIGDAGNRTGTLHVPSHEIMGRASVKGSQDVDYSCTVQTSP